VVALGSLVLYLSSFLAVSSVSSSAAMAFGSAALFRSSFLSLFVAVALPYQEVRRIRVVRSASARGKGRLKVSGFWVTGKAT